MTLNQIKFKNCVCICKEHMHQNEAFPWFGFYANVCNVANVANVGNVLNVTNVANVLNATNVRNASNIDELLTTIVSFALKKNICS